MSQDFQKRATTFGGDVRWTPTSAAVCVERRDDQWGVRELEPTEKPLVTARVLPPNSAWFLTHAPSDLETEIQKHPDHTFTSIGQHGTDVLVAGIRTRRLKKLPPGDEAVPAEVALAYLSLWADTREECVGLHWSDGFDVLRVVTRESTLWLHEASAIAEVADDIPWVDHSTPGVARTLDPRLKTVAGSCGFTAGTALAVGAAACAAHECGGFVNPRPQSVVRDGVMTMTMPMRQVTGGGGRQRH